MPLERLFRWRMCPGFLARLGILGLLAFGAGCWQRGPLYDLLFAGDGRGSQPSVNSSPPTPDLDPPPDPVPDPLPDPAPVPSLDAPRMGDIWAGERTVAWTPAAGSGAVDVLVSGDSGGSYGPLAQGVANSGAFLWDTTSLPDGSTYRIRVVGTSGAIQAASGGDFALDNTRPSTAVLEPGGGEVWSATRTIRWATTDAHLGEVEIRLSTDSGATYPIVVEAGTPDDGSYAWDTSGLSDASTCRIRITAYDGAGNAGAPAVSAADFALDGTPPSTVLVEPVGGEVWSGPRTIRWATTDEYPGTVDLRLSTDSGLSYPIVIAAGTPDDGSFDWDTGTVAPSAACRIQATPRDRAGNIGTPTGSGGDFSIDQVTPDPGTSPLPRPTYLPATLEFAPRSDTSVPGEPGGPRPFFPFRAIAPTSGAVGVATEVVAVLDSATAEPLLATVDGVAVGDLRVLSGRVLLFHVPPLASPGAATIRVETSGGTELARMTYRYVSAGSRVQQTFSEVAPKSGPLTGGTEVWVVGQGFVAGTEVRFGDTAVLATVVSPNVLQVLTPPSATPGYVPLSVSVPGSTQAILESGFLYTRAATPPEVLVRRRTYLGVAGNVTAADLDRDGFTDLVSYSDLGSVGVLRALPTLSYRGVEVHPGDLGGANESFAIAHRCDIDEDGLTDFLAAERGTSTQNLVIFESAAGGGFAPRYAEVAAPPYSIAALATVDFDRDGRLDILIGGVNGEVSSYRGVGSWRFQWWATSAVPGNTLADVGVLPSASGGSPEILGVGDDLIDGWLHRYYLTLASVLADGRIVVGSWRIDLGPYAPRPLAVADLSGDGISDVAIEESLHLAAVVRDGNGGASLARVADERPGVVAAGDLTGDGLDDLVGTYTVWPSISGVAVYENAGSLSFVRRDLATPAASRPSGMCVADVDRDGRVDIVMVARGDSASPPVRTSGSYGDLVQSYLASATGGFQLAEPRLLDQAGVFLAVAAVEDRGADAFPDLVFFSSIGPAIVTMGRGGIPDAPCFLAIPPTATTYTPYQTRVLVDDLTHDGLPDLLIARSDLRISEPLYIARGRSDGSFEAPVAAGGSLVLAARWLADLDVDGLPDLVGLDVQGAAVVLPGRVGPSFGTPIVVRPVSSPYPGSAGTVIPADIDHDGLSDLFYSSWQIARWPEFLRNRGALAFQSTPIGDADQQLTDGVVLADLDGDGHVDAAWARGAVLKFARGDGQGGFTSGPDIAIGTVANGRTVAIWKLATGDLDGDGTTDIAAFASTSSAEGDGVVLLRGAGDGSFLPGMWVRLPPSPHALSRTAVFPIVEDLDADGRAEIAMAGDNLVVILDLDPTGVAGP